jgi:hypothetical protein
MMVDLLWKTENHFKDINSLCQGKKGCDSAAAPFRVRDIRQGREAIETEKKALDLEPENKEFKENLAFYGRESKQQ